MSRSLGRVVTAKKAHANRSYQARGAAMFLAGEPCPRNVSTKGKEHSLWQGWQRARMAAQKKA